VHLKKKKKFLPGCFTGDFGIICNKTSIQILHSGDSTTQAIIERVPPFFFLTVGDSAFPFSQTDNDDFSVLVVSSPIRSRKNYEVK